jgi:hypothetical protein
LVEAVMREHFMPTAGASLFTYPVVGVYRHDRLNKRPDRWSVVVCLCGFIADGEICFDAVMDDFGNLVRVQ